MGNKLKPMSEPEPGYRAVQCPKCERFVCEAANGSHLRLQCAGCGHLWFEMLVDDDWQFPEVM